MIEQIALKNFKGVRQLNLDCGGLTLLAGANASGKSTILQSLLLLAQSEFSSRTVNLSLNGPYVNFGDVNQLQYAWSEDSRIYLGYQIDGCSLMLNIKTSIDDSRDVLPIKVRLPKEAYGFIQSLKYLSASRIGPNNIFSHSTNEIVTKNSVGINGEYTVAYLAKFGEKSLNVQKLRHPRDDHFGVVGSLSANVTAWLQAISPGVQFAAKVLPEIGTSVVNYGYPGLGTQPSLTSHNVGFGITYVLPVITRILMSKPGDILILENPEAHVHPRGQVEIGRLIARAADNGIQIFLETHSDHIFNGIRLEFQKSDSLHSKCRMYYATRFEEGNQFESKFDIISLGKDGKIQSAPVGFFDEWESALMELL